MLTLHDRILMEVFCDFEHLRTNGKRNVIPD